MRWLVFLVASCAWSQGIPFNANGMIHAAAAANPTFVENVVSSGSTASTYVATVTSTTAGDTLTCISYYEAAETFSSLTDNQSQSYASVTAPTLFDAANNKYRIDQVVSSAAGVTTITETFTGNGHGALLCNHSRGIVASPVDQNVFNATATGSTTWTSGNTSTLAQAAEIAIGFAYCTASSNCTFVAGSGWSNLVRAGNGGIGVDMAIETQVTAATTAIAATGTISPTGNNVYVGIVTLK